MSHPAPGSADDPPPTNVAAQILTQLFPEFLGPDADAPSLRFAAGEVLVTADAPGDEAFLLLEGVVDVLGLRRDGAPVHWATLQPGTLFGEMALLEASSPARNATVVARTEVRVRVVTRTMLREALGQKPDLEQALVLERQHQVALAALDRSPLYEILDTLRADPVGSTRSFAAGEDLMREGEPSEGMYILLSGTAVVYRQLDGLELQVARLMPGACAGERSLITGAPRSATVRAEGPLTALYVERARFLAIYVRSEDLRAYLGTLQRTYQLPEKGFTSREVAVHEGASCLRTTFELPGGRRVVCITAPERPLHLVQVEGAAQTAARVWTWAGQQGQGLRLEVDTRGAPVLARVEGDHPDLQVLYGCFFEGIALPVSVCAELERTGRLRLPQKLLTRLEDGVVCTCMEVTEERIRRVVRTFSPTLDQLEAMLGCGSVCGGCRFQLEELVAG